VYKVVDTSEDMEQRQQWLTNHAVIITEEGPMGVCSREEVKDLIQHHLGISKHEFSVYRSNPEPFIAFFHDTYARDVVFAATRIIDGPVELGFHAWELDRFGEREIIPYLEADEIHHPPTRHCGRDLHQWNHPRDDDVDKDREQKRPRARNLISRFSDWMDGRGKSRDRQVERGRDWLRGESSRGRYMASNEMSPPPSRVSSPEERRALRGLWQSKGGNSPTKSNNAAEGSKSLQFVGTIPHHGGYQTDAILIIPHDHDFGADMM
jgi:hypothetical protein